MNAPSAEAPIALPEANGIDAPLNPFVVAPPSPDGRENEIPGYVKRFGAYHTLTEGVFLPAGTLLPKGAAFAMQSTIDFGLHFPAGTKVPGGFLLPVSVVKKRPGPPPPAPDQPDPLCSIQ